MTVPVTARVNPYPGLAPFGEEDAARFFGRDREIDEVLDRLSSRRLLAIIGVSGCGKSSLVRAGVIPVLRMGVPVSISARWRIRTMRPGNNPLNSLAGALGVPPGWPRSTFDLVDHARSNLAIGENLLLIVDQFEELFRFRSENITRDGGNAASLFVNLLLNAIDQREVALYAVLTMRTDFLGECAQFRGLPEALNDCYYLVPRMTRLQQQEAIEGPLQRQGTTIHPTLTQRLLNESAEDPDQLPVLQHLLRRLWENWSCRGGDDTIGIEDYDAVGGWANALNIDAEAVLARYASEEESIRALFQWITDYGTGDKPIHRPRPFSECVEVSNLGRQRLSEIIRAFQERRLLQQSDLTDDSLVELPHESLTWQWARLKRWIVEEAEQAAQMRFLLQAARQQMPLTGLALESGLRLRSRWQKQRLPALRYFEPQELEQMQAWIDCSEEFDRKQRRSAEARELSAWAALSLGDDPERSLILGLYSWSKQPAMVVGLEELLHVALLRSPGRLCLQHEGSVWSVAWSPDGKKLATASADWTAKVWDIETGCELLSIRGHQNSVWCVAWAPDGNKLATASLDKTVKVWNTETGRELLSLSGHEYAIVSVAWSPDGSRLATASDDNTAKVWHVATGCELLTLQGHQSAIWSIAWSPDGSKLATASRDHTAKVWEADTGWELVTLYGHQADVRSITWSPDGSRLATASFDNTATIWEAATGRGLFALHHHQFALLSIAWSPDGRNLATASFDNTATIWEASTGRLLSTLRGHQAAVLSVAWSPDGAMLATASDDHRAKVVQLSSGGEMLTFDGHHAPVWSIDWSPDGSKLASGSDHPAVRIWEADSGRELIALRGHESHVESVAWSPDGTRLATSLDHMTQVWKADTGRAVLRLCGHEDYVCAIAWSPDGSKLATASRDHTAKVWEARTGRELITLYGHQADVRSIAWSPDGSKLATASDDNTARIWDVSTGREALTFRAHGAAVSSIAWSPNGGSLATASFDNTAKIWDANTGRELITFRGHQAAVLSIAWSPDGSKFATGSWDNTVKVWETTGQELLTLRGHMSAVWSVAWSPDGKRLASAGTDGLVQVYAIDHTLLLRLVRSRITRDLTRDECHRFLHSDQCLPLPDVP